MDPYKQIKMNRENIRFQEDIRSQRLKFACVSAVRAVNDYGNTVICFWTILFLFLYILPPFNFLKKTFEGAALLILWTKIKFFWNLPVYRETSNNQQMHKQQNWPSTPLHMDVWTCGQ